MIQDFFRLFIDTTCLGCQNPLTIQESYICMGCLAQIETTNFHLQPKDNELYQRIGGRMDISSAASLFYFDKAGKLQRLLKALKYSDLPEIGIYLGQLLVHYWGHHYPWEKIEALVPIPLHWTKQIKRGYNQAEKIAEGISEETGIPVLNNFLIRSRKTASQAQKSGHHRWENVSGAFETRGEAPTSILLIDDVITTGATIVAAGKAFSNLPVDIHVASVALTRSH